MPTHTFGYTTVIIVQQILMAGLVWYIVHLLDSSRRERRRLYSTMLFTNASARCDLAALAARLSKLSGQKLGAVNHPVRVRSRQEQQV